jgi:1-acyl-sn-glycerol-3-phosphate acyltransferase
LGIENIPKTPSIVLSKHQSAWETLAFQQIFPAQVWVLKKELLHIPFFGWGLAMTSPIAINRSSGRAALKQIVQQGKDRLKQGLWIVIFPEGTRIVPGKKGKYGIGGAWLATHTGVSVVPVAHNAGELWGKNSFIKRPGTITVSIGAPIDPAGMKASELNARIESWIELEVARIGEKNTV